MDEASGRQETTQVAEKFAAAKKHRSWPLIGRHVKKRRLLLRMVRTYFHTKICVMAFQCVYLSIIQHIDTLPKYGHKTSRCKILTPKRYPRYFDMGLPFSPPSPVVILDFSSQSGTNLLILTPKRYPCYFYMGLPFPPPPPWSF